MTCFYLAHGNGKGNWAQAFGGESNDEPGEFNIEDCGSASENEVIASQEHEGMSTDEDMQDCSGSTVDRDYDSTLDIIGLELMRFVVPSLPWALIKDGKRVGMVHQLSSHTFKATCSMGHRPWEGGRRCQCSLFLTSTNDVGKLVLDLLTWVGAGANGPYGECEPKEHQGIAHEYRRRYSRRSC